MQLVLKAAQGDPKISEIYFDAQCIKINPGFSCDEGDVFINSGGSYNRTSYYKQSNIERLSLYKK